MNKIWCFISSLILLISCDDPIKSELPSIDYKPQIVLYGDISPQRGAFLEIRRTLNPSQTYTLDETLLRDAKVKLYNSDDELIGSLKETEKGLYQLNSSQIVENNSYKVEVSSNGFDSVFAFAHVPPPLQNVNLVIDSFYFDDFFGNTDVDVFLQIEIHESIKSNLNGDLYKLNIYTDSILVDWVPQLIIGTNGSNIDPNFCGMGGKEVLYGDPLVYSNTCRNELRFESRLEFSISKFGLPIQNCYFYISQVSPDYVNFASFWDANDVDLLVTNPDKIYTNVINGQGVFSGRNISLKKITIDFENKEVYLSN